MRFFIPKFSIKLIKTFDVERFIYEHFKVEHIFNILNTMVDNNFKEIQEKLQECSFEILESYWDGRYDFWMNLGNNVYLKICDKKDPRLEIVLKNKIKTADGLTGWSDIKTLYNTEDLHEILQKLKQLLK